MPGFARWKSTPPIKVAKMMSMPGVVIQLKVAFNVFSPTGKAKVVEMWLSEAPTLGKSGEQTRMKMNIKA